MKRTLFLLLALLALPGLGSGCIDNDPGVRFSFDQPGGRSHVSSSGFCLGTRSSVLVTSGYEEELGPWTAESSDSAVFTVDRDMDYPDWLTLSYLSEGEATLIVRAESGGEKLDDFPIRVHVPEGLSYRLGHPAVDTEPLTGTARVPVGGGSCSVELFPYRTQDDVQQPLYGKYELTMGSPALGWTLDPLGFYEPALVLFARETMRFIVLASTTAAGPEEITFTGPMETQVTVALQGVEATELTGITLQTAPYYSDPPAQVGDTGTFVAVQHSADGQLCRGFPVVFTSLTPDTLWIRDDGELDTDHQAFELLAAGDAEVQVSLPGRPELDTRLVIEVTP